MTVILLRQDEVKFNSNEEEMEKSNDKICECVWNFV